MAHLTIIGANSGSVYQLLAGVSGAIVVIIVALGIALARTREDVSKIKEWQRIIEKRLNGDKDDHS